MRGGLVKNEGRRVCVYVSGFDCVSGAREYVQYGLMLVASGKVTHRGKSAWKVGYLVLTEHAERCQSQAGRRRALLEVLEVGCFGWVGRSERWGRVLPGESAKSEVGGASRKLR